MTWRERKERRQETKTQKPPKANKTKARRRRTGQQTKMQEEKSQRKKNMTSSISKTKVSLTSRRWPLRSIADAFFNSLAFRTRDLDQTRILRNTDIQPQSRTCTARLPERAASDDALCYWRHPFKHPLICPNKASYGKWMSYTTPMGQVAYQVTCLHVSPFCKICMALPVRITLHLHQTWSYAIEWSWRKLHTSSVFI